jgi:ubiquinone/menaquinone biosynthesis C-methylase UbiE
MENRYVKILEVLGSLLTDDLSMSDIELQKYLIKVKHFFDINKLLNVKITEKDVIDYYIESEAGYEFFHSPEGAVHMALNYDGVFNKDGYYGQAQLVQKQIMELLPKFVLELGSGKGFNTLYLAKRNQGIDFWGIDITPNHIVYAKDKAVEITNLHFQQANFQALQFKDNTFDIVYEVESVCHAENMEQALSEIYRVLRPSGRFIVFDGFRKSGFDQFNEDIKLASRLSEIAMAIANPWIIDDWLTLAQKIGFEVINIDDLSEAIMPNLLKFQLLARGYFKFPSLSRMLLNALPTALVKNSIAGLLMPFTIKAKAQGYFNIVIRKPQAAP